MMLIERFSVAVEPLVSVTPTVNETVPSAVGVPVIVPVEASSEIPDGRTPEVMLHLYGLEPPVAVTELE
jgi:hypothetical protein